LIEKFKGVFVQADNGPDKLLGVGRLAGPTDICLLAFLGEEHAFEPVT
jgi:hypothetical protein